MNPRTRRKPMIGAASLLAVSAFSLQASAADTAIAFDLDYALPIQADAVSSGYGFGIRLGSQTHVPLIVVTPELGFTYHRFNDAPGPKVLRGIGGLRIGVGELIRPGLFAHAGYGARKFEFATHTDTAWSFTYDVGASLDITPLPVLNIGAHGAYNRWTGGDQPTFQFATLGVHAGLIF